MYGKLYDFTRQKKFALDDNNYYIHITTGTHVAQICLFLLNESHHLPGKLIQTQPSRRTSPAGKYTLIDLDLSRYDQLAKRFAAERKNDQDFLKSGIDTKNKRFNQLIEKIERVAIRSQEPILLSGPTGAGKSQLAKRIYELKLLNHQLNGKFVEVNCATLRGDQAMASLFGHRKGAFTGASQERGGLLKAANGGILFLDEIGELGLDEQAMLLRAIEEKRFLPLGSDQEEKSNFQLICGTNRNLQSEITQGNFRSDLLQRINLWNFQLPGLAERREDIEPNIDYELEQFTRKNNLYVSFNFEARNRFMEYALSPTNLWLGNFRELNAIMTRLATLAPGGRIDLTTVEEELTELEDLAYHSPSANTLLPFLGENYQTKYDRFDLVQLAEVITVCLDSNTAAEASRKLFAASRLNKQSSNDTDRISKYLAKFGLSWTTLKSKQ